MPSPTRFLRAAQLNGRVFCCQDNMPFCECKYDNPRIALHRRGKSFRVPLCVVSADVEFCPPDKHSDRSPADRGIHSVATGSAGLLRAAHTAWPPENRSLVSPSSRYSLAWCSRDRPPSVVVFYSAAFPGDPLLAVAAHNHWPRLLRSLPQSIRAPHP